MGVRTYEGNPERHRSGKVPSYRAELLSRSQGHGNKSIVLDGHKANILLTQEPECQFPCIFKVGHAHGGLGKVKVETETAFHVSLSFKLSREV